MVRLPSLCLFDLRRALLRAVEGVKALQCFFVGRAPFVLRGALAQNVHHESLDVRAAREGLQLWADSPNTLVDPVRFGGESLPALRVHLLPDVAENLADLLGASYQSGPL